MSSQLIPRKGTVVDRVLRDVLETEIGREAVIEALEIATAGLEGDSNSDNSSNPADLPRSGTKLGRLRALLESFQDPAFSGAGITTLMRDCRVSSADLMNALRQREVAIALFTSGRKMGDVLEGLASAAAPKVVQCRHCSGEGYVGVGVKDDDLGGDDTADLGEEELELPQELCPDCQGEGKLIQTGDVDAIKLYLQVHGLAGKSGKDSAAMIVNNNVTTQAGVRVDSAGNAMESVTSRISKAITGGGSGRD